ASPSRHGVRRSSSRRIEELCCGRTSPHKTSGSLLIPHHRPAAATEVKDFRRLGVLGRLQAQVQEHALPTELALERQFGGMNVLAGADAHSLRLEVLQELQHVEVETGPDGFTVLLAAHDFLNGGVGPDFPEVVSWVGLEVAEPDLQGEGVPLPA